MNQKIKYNCIFGGGGIRGMCHVGVLRALNEYGIEIDSIAGSSVGAVFASLFAAGYNANEIEELFIEFNFNMFRDLNINLFNSDISLSKGEIFLEWLREKISIKYCGEKNKKVTFKDLEKNLYILSIDLKTNTPFIFSKTTTPDEEVALAVRTSASLPGLMKPININNSILVDGDLIKSWPAWKVYEELNNPNHRLLELRLEGSRDGSDIKNPMDFLNSIINTIWYLSTENVFNSYQKNDRYDYIVIDTKDIILFDFTIDKSTKEALVEKGYQTAKQYLVKTLTEKKKNILPVYQKILKKINILLKAINANRPTEVMFIINDILSEMKEDTEYIDISIYEELKNLKGIIQNNIKHQLIFGKKFENTTKIKDKTHYIKLLTEERINDISDYVTNFSKNC